MADQEELFPGNGIEKTPTGIEGFDEITQGGLPRGRTTLVMGAPGCGKTVFALQTLVNGARRWNEPGIFVAFEEKSRQIIENAASFGWNLPELERDKLFFLDARLSPDTVQTGEFDLIGMLAGLKAKVDEMGARRIVFDSVDVLLSLINDERAERQEVYRVRDWFQETGLTGLLTSRALEPERYSTYPYDFLQFMADCAVLLNHRLVERISVREMRILKYRGSSFTENEFPMTIGPAGIEVAGISPVQPEHLASSERISTGVPRLDTMLNGGYYRGSSVLITGAPGTAKSTLTGAFVEAACTRGERALFVSFDEGGSEIVRNLTSVNIHLSPHLDSGQLMMYSGQTESQSPERHLIALRELMRSFRPTCMVIDPLSALVKTGEAFSAQRVALWLLRLAKLEDITIVCTSLLAEGETDIEATSINVSTLADVWIHLSYVVSRGERNRALSIVKARGTQHSNQVRELRLSDSGVTLTDVYTSGGEVLMGTLRYERELLEEAEKQRIRDELERRRAELQLAEAETSAQMEALKMSLEQQRIALYQLEREQAEQEKHWSIHHQQLQQLRSADQDAPEHTPNDDRFPPDGGTPDSTEV